MMASNKFLAAALAVALGAGCSVKMGGKSFGMPTGGGGGGGGGGSSGSSGGSSGSSDASAEPDDDDDPYNNQPYTKKMKAARARAAPSQPADPWAGVDGDLPVQKADDDYVPNDTAADCSAAHDHCLPEWTWFVESASKSKDLFRYANPQQYAINDQGELGFVGFGATDYFGDDMIAYRTVPVTKSNLKKGSLTVVVPYPDQVPSSEAWATQNDIWHLGTVESIDWKAGKVRLLGHNDPYWLSGTRVAVLEWKPGGKVTIRGKLKRDELAVAKGDVILPKGDVARTTPDPWAEVGKDGQPKAAKDDTILDGTATVTCDAAHDHCLRPWTWFISDTHGAWPSIFSDGVFHRLWAMDNLGPVDKGMAYRTVPATEDNLKEGATVFFLRRLPQHEDEAQTDAWFTGTVAELQIEAGKFQIEGEKEYFPIEAARIAVLQWFPGEKAEKVE